MSGQSLVIFLSVLAIALAANRAEEDTRGDGMHRGLASISSHNAKELQFAQQSEVIRRTHKTRGPISVEIQLIGNAPEKSGDVFVLKGVISSETQLRGVDFQWLLPTGVEVVNGELSSVAQNINEGKPFETEITLRQMSSTNERIMLKARGKDSGMKFGDAAVYHSLNQERLEASRKTLMKSTEEYVQEQSKLKIFH